jgi:urea transport system substrate-binding protein
LVGGASVGFNRAFASFGLADKVTRLGTLIEENTLGGIGMQNAANLYSSSGYFASIDTPAAIDFAKRYGAKFGAQAPALNALAQSVYDGFLLLEAMAKKSGSMDPKKMETAAEGIRFSSPRGDTTMHQRHGKKDIYLAKAEGNGFKVVKVFKQVDAGKNCKA